MTELDDLATAAAYARPVHAHQPGYAAPARPPARVPSYTGITIGARLLIAFGIMCVVGAAVVVGIAIFGAVATVAQSRDGGGVAAVLLAGTTVPFALAALGWGILFVLVGTVAIAIRDIARNSFRR
ncbi:MAG: hypothetical protein JWO31_955 [Phycisphaerales bacterium]|nr:hypothetical protein [Phycisphaerales bacterium]